MSTRIDFHVYVHDSDCPVVDLSFSEDGGQRMIFELEQAELDVPAIMGWATSTHDIVTVELEVYYRAEHSSWHMTPDDARWQTFLFLCDQVRAQYIHELEAVS